MAAFDELDGVRMTSASERTDTGTPPMGAEFSCLCCGMLRPWAVWANGQSVCEYCRDAAKLRPFLEADLRTLANWIRATRPSFLADEVRLALSRYAAAP